MNRIQRRRNKYKKIDKVQAGLHILNFAHSFGKGMLPHNTGDYPRECLGKYSKDEAIRARCNNKTSYEYLLYLKELYRLYINAELFNQFKEKNMEKLEQCNEIIGEFEYENGTV